MATVAEQAEALSRLQPTMEGATRELWKTRELELRAGAAEVSGKIDNAIAGLRQAIALDERTPPSGPAGEATPRELLGELLQRQGKPAGALIEFVKTLESHPGRTRALLGAARAATATGDHRAPGWWSRLAGLWAEADSNTAGLDETHRFRPTGTAPE